MDVFLANEQDLSVGEARLSALARHALTSMDVDSTAELSILMVAPAHIRRLNARFAGDDAATDVLSFPMMDEEDSPLLLGDIVLCPEVARANASRLGHSLDKELEVLLVHGALHLLGYDHQGSEDRAEMESHVGEIIASFRFPAVRES